METKKLRPFSNGTEYEIWDNNNCDKCARVSKSRNKPYSGCTAEKNVAISIWEGTIPEKTADWIGTENKGDGFCRLLSRCNKFIPRGGGGNKPKKPKPTNPSQLQVFPPDFSVGVKEKVLATKEDGN